MPYLRNIAGITAEIKTPIEYAITKSLCCVGECFIAMTTAEIVTMLTGGMIV